jgi:hypothetical protein
VAALGTVRGLWNTIAVMLSSNCIMLLSSMSFRQQFFAAMASSWSGVGYPRSQVLITFICGVSAAHGRRIP